MSRHTHVLTGLLAFSLLAACGGDENNSANNTNNSSNNTSNSSNNAANSSNNTSNNANNTANSANNTSNNANNTANSANNTSNNANNTANNTANNANNTSNNANNMAQLPDEAFSWELPEGAEEVEWATYEEALAAGTHVAFSRELLLAQRASREAREAEDEATIQAFLAEHPDARINVPELPEGVTPDPDGNLRVAMRVGAQETLDVTLLGPHWSKHNIAEAIRNYPTRANQIAIYESFYDDLPSDIIGSLQLPTPAEIEANPGQFEDDKIAAYVDAVAEKVDVIPAVPFPFPEGKPEGCDDEVGAGAGGDRHDTSEAFDPGGLYARHDWPTKEYTTCVKNQAVRGTCVAMSSVSAIEQLVAQRHNVWVNLSEQWLYNRMKFAWERQDYGDGYFTWKVATQLRDRDVVIPYEEAWNYNPSWERVDGVFVCQDVYCNGDYCADCADNPSWWYYLFSCEDYTETCGDSTHQSELICAKDTSGAYHCAFAELPEKNPMGLGYASHHFANLWDHDNVDLSMARVIISLALGKPLVAGMPLYESFDQAETNRGFVPMPDVENEELRGGHAMHVLAYVDNDDLPAAEIPFPQGEGGGWFIIKNSWGTRFGDGGYLYIPYAYFTEHVDDVVSFQTLEP